MCLQTFSYTNAFKSNLSSIPSRFELSGFGAERACCRIAMECEISVAVSGSCGWWVTPSLEHPTKPDPYIKAMKTPTFPYMLASKVWKTTWGRADPCRRGCHDATL